MTTSKAYRVAAARRVRSMRRKGMTLAAIGRVVHANPASVLRWCRGDVPSASSAWMIQNFAGGAR